MLVFDVCCAASSRTVTALRQLAVMATLYRYAVPLALAMFPSYLALAINGTQVTSAAVLFSFFSFLFPWPLPFIGTICGMLLERHFAPSCESNIFLHFPTIVHTYSEGLFFLRFCM